MSTYSPNLRIELPTNGTQAGVWGDTTNNNLAYILDTAVSGYQTVSVTSASQALTYTNGPSSTAASNQAVYAMLRFTTTTGAAFAVYAPPASKAYIVWNNSGYSMTIYNSTVIGNTTAAGTGVTVTNGSKIMVWSDATNFYELQAANLTGTLAIANGGTGQITANAAFNALAPVQTSANGKYLKSNGTDTSWDAIDLSTADIAGTLPVANGGTGQASNLTQYGVVYGSTTTAMATTLAGTSTQVLKGNASGAPTWGSVSLTANVSGTLPIANGGTNSTATPTDGGIVYGTGTAQAYTIVGVPGQVLVSNGAGAQPYWINQSSLFNVLSAQQATLATTATLATLATTATLATLATLATSATTATLATLATTANNGAKAWVNFAGASGTINAGFNVTNVTRVGAGTYTIVFSSAFADTNYALSISAGSAANGNTWSMYESNYAARTTSQVTIAINSGGTAFDPTFMSVIVFR